jgi:rare lipoprotein A (peptidoglycan hydrolase)
MRRPCALYPASLVRRFQGSNQRTPSFRGEARRSKNPESSNHWRRFTGFRVRYTQPNLRRLRKLACVALRNDNLYGIGRLVPVKLAASFRWRAIVPGAVAHRNALAAAIFVLAAATLAIVNYQTAEQDTDAIEDGRNQTVVFRQAGGAYRGLEAMEAVADQQEEDDAGVVPWNFPRAVRTLRFFNRGSSAPVGSKRERLSTSRPYTVRGRTYVPTDNPAYAAEGVASWYGPDFHGHLTANGEHYDMNGFSAAHRTMPLPSYARVTNLDNGRSIIVRVNNRGPFVHNRIADLSVGTAKALDFYKKGTAHVRVEYVGPAPAGGSDDQMLLATLRAGSPAPAPANLMVASAKPFTATGGNASER